MLNFDIKTIILFNLCTSFLCTVLIFTAWKQNKDKTPALRFILFQFGLHFTGTCLLLTRYILPDYISMILSNTLIIMGAVAGVVGVQKLSGSKSTPIFHSVLLALFIIFQSYFVYIEHSLTYRNINISTAILLLSAQAVIPIFSKKALLNNKLIFIRISYLLLFITSLVRVIEIFITHPLVNDFYKSGNFEVFILISYTLFFVFLSYAVLLFVNNNLIDHILERDIQFQNLVDNMQDACFRVNSNGTIIMHNNAANEIFKYSSNTNLNGLKMLNLYKDPTDRQLILEMLKRNCKVTDFICLGKCGDSSIIWMSVSAKFWYSKTGEVAGTDVIIRDISERKRIEMDLVALKERELKNERQFKRLVETTPVLLYDYVLNSDETNQFLYVSPNCYEILGISQKQMISNINSFISIVHPDDILRLKEEDIYANLHADKFSLELRIVTADGDLKWIEMSSRPTTSKYGDKFIWSGYMKDITEQKVTEKEIKELNSKLEQLVLSRTAELADLVNLFETVVNSSSIGIFACEENGPCVLANPAVAKISETSVEVMRSLNYKKIPKWNDNGLRKTVETVMSTNTEISEEIHLMSRVEKDMWLRYHISPFRYHDKTHFLMMVDDITQRKLLEIELTEHKSNLQKIVHSRTRELAEMVEKLEQSNRDLEQFAYVASHDLQEPLRMISSYTQLLERRYKNVLDDNAKLYIEHAVNGASRLQILINDLLKLSRISTSEKEFVEVDLNETLKIVLNNLNNLIVEKSAIVIVNKLPVVTANENHMVLLFQNLLTNAIKFCNKRPYVEIESQQHEKYFIIRVKDNGIGIDMKYKNKIFTIFQRLHTRQEFPGTGIGLALCKKIIQIHKGEIWLTSVPNEGTTFSVALKV